MMKNTCYLIAVSLIISTTSVSANKGGTVHMDLHAFEDNKENLALGGKEDYKKFMEEENHEH